MNNDPEEPIPIEAVNYYDNGGVRNRGFRLNGDMHGEWEFFRKDGSLMRAGGFNRGMQVGVWRTLDRNGRLVKETNFPAG